MKASTLIASTLISVLGFAGTALADKHDHKEKGHTHGPTCGHTAVTHDGHTDYVHMGHLHNVDGGKVADHKFAVNDANPDREQKTTEGHDATHKHGPKCGHEAVPHGTHTDYIVNGTLHRAHGDHCDDHGSVTKAG